MIEPVVLVCARVTGKLLMPDNLTGPCAACGATVQYRPHAPEPRILRCIECAASLIAPGDEIGTTAQMLEDFHAYLRKQQN